MEIDWLTPSYSLPQILQYLDAEDILKCKLVNQRLYGVISANSQTMPRRYAELVVTTDVLKEDDTEYTRPQWIRVKLITQKRDSTDKFVEDTTYTFFVSEHRMRMELPMKHRAIVRYYDNNDEQLAEGAILPGETAYDFSRSRSYRVESMFEGMRKLLSFIFHRYHFFDIYLHDQDVLASLKTLRIPEDLLLMIQEEYRRAKCENRTLHFSYTWPEMSAYYSKFGVRSVTIHPYCSIATLIPLITNWDYDFCFRVSPREFDDLQPFVDLLKEWERGSVCLDSIYFYLENWQPFLWTSQDLTDALSCFQKLPEENIECSMKEERDHFLIARALDNSQLIISYSKAQEDMFVQRVK